MTAADPALERGWRGLYVCQDDHTTESMRHFPSCQSLCRQIRKDHRFINQMVFLVLHAATALKMHCDPFNYLVSVHLGVVVPSGCGLQVGPAQRVHEIGRCLAFDNSFFHTAWNRGSRARVVLAVHTLHPDLTEVEREALRVLHPILRLHPMTARTPH
jgi:aspartyl/asparaginyl beta-hydroxylase (cupin superfamily)